MKAKVLYCFLCVFLVLTVTSCGDKIDRALDNYEEYVDDFVADVNSGKILETLSTSDLQSKLETELDYYKNQGEMSASQERRYEKIHMKLFSILLDPSKMIENSAKQVEDLMEKSASAFERSAKSVSKSMNSLESLFDDVYDEDDE